MNGCQHEVLVARVISLELLVKLLESELERLKSLDREVDDLKNWSECQNTITNNCSFRNDLL